MVLPLAMSTTCDPGSSASAGRTTFCVPLLDESGADQRMRPPLTTPRCAEAEAAVPRSTLATGLSECPCPISMESSGGGTHSRCAAVTVTATPTANSASPAHPRTRWSGARRARPRGGPGDSGAGPLPDTSVPATADSIRWFIRCDHSPTNASWFSSQPFCPSDSAVDSDGTGGDSLWPWTLRQGCLSRRAGRRPSASRAKRMMMAIGPGGRWRSGSRRPRRVRSPARRPSCRRPRGR